MISKKTILLMMLPSLCLTSCRNDIEKAIREFSSQKISLPYDVLDKQVCSPFADTITDNKTLRLVNFIDTMQCHSCEMNRLIEYERLNMSRPELERLEFVYIVNTPSTHIKRTNQLLHSLRVGGSVYLDTCNAFRKENPNFPNNKLFYSFVLNREGNVVLVGNPFQNERMEKLLMKVLEADSCQYQ